ncbi:prepilin-type cleavage/methylation N-terminal domain protein [Peptoniphilus sp. oral taxon 375 str. F0436]|nr:prepilin-type cleavage/methylation N-terminal domain protein [Peptoniphilus sp. oral taxon 375 str. F0436]
MKKGSSLLEVLVVVSILSLLLTVTLPRFSYIQKYKEKEKLKKFVSIRSRLDGWLWILQGP